MSVFSMVSQGVFGQDSENILPNEQWDLRAGLSSPVQTQRVLIPGSGNSSQSDPFSNVQADASNGFSCSLTLFSIRSCCEVGAQLSPDHRLSYRVFQLLERKYMWFLLDFHWGKAGSLSQTFPHRRGSGYKLGWTLLPFKCEADTCKWSLWCGI